MSDLHSLVSKQIARSRRTDGSLDIERFSRMVSDAYTESDHDRRRTDHSIRMMVDELDHRASHDAMTGLANRTRMTTQLKRALGPDENPSHLAVMFLDLDFFKDVNDSFGHAAGDELLRQVSRRLTQVVGARGMVARLGGDEFAVIVWAMADRGEIGDLARRIVYSLSEFYEIESQRVVIGCSIGIALSPEHGRTPNDLLRRADMALYRAKQTGRGKIAFFERCMDEVLVKRKSIEDDLRTALVENHFELYFQPIIEAQTYKVRSFEALIRLIDPVRGVISPMDFIPIAESTGLIVPIGEWVIRSACAQSKMLPKDASIAINLSPVQIRSDSLVSVIKEALANSGLEPHRLELEITESVMLQEDPRSMKVLEQLRGLGIRFALDDFGTGYSTLSYLQKFHFDKIKIDRSFCSSIDSNPLNAALVRAIAGIGRDLGIDIVAEGVETSKESQSLVAEGCGFLQGYLYGKPAPVSSLGAHDDPAIILARRTLAQMQAVSQENQVIDVGNVVPLALKRG